MKNGRPPLTIDKEVCERIKEARKSKQMTQKELAERLSVSVQSVKNWEQGINGTDDGMLKKIAAICEVDFAWLRNVQTRPQDNNDVLIGSRLEEYRKKLNMTHEKFAIFLNVSQSQVRNYQKGRQPVPETVIKKLSNGNQVAESFLRGLPGVSIDDVELDLSKTEKTSFLQYYTTDELLAELKRRIEAP